MVEGVCVRRGPESPRHWCDSGAAPLRWKGTEVGESQRRGRRPRVRLQRSPHGGTAWRDGGAGEGKGGVWELVARQRAVPCHWSLRAWARRTESSVLGPCCRSETSDILAEAGMFI